MYDHPLRVLDLNLSPIVDREFGVFKIADKV